MSSLLVCDIPPSLTEESLHELFMEFGSCSCERTKKDAVITYSLTSEAKEAFFSLNGFLGIQVIPQFSATHKRSNKSTITKSKRDMIEINYSEPVKFCYARRQGEKDLGINYYIEYK